MLHCNFQSHIEIHFSIDILRQECLSKHSIVIRFEWLLLISILIRFSMNREIVISISTSHTIITAEQLSLLSKLSSLRLIVEILCKNHRKNTLGEYFSLSLSTSAVYLFFIQLFLALCGMLYCECSNLWIQHNFIEAHMLCNTITFAVA